MVLTNLGEAFDRTHGSGFIIVKYNLHALCLINDITSTVKTCWCDANTTALQEMQRLDADSNVYKLIGPVLVKQDQEEAKQNVQKRIDYITTELWVHVFHWPN